MRISLCYQEIIQLIMLDNRTVKKSRDAYVKRLNGIYENNLKKVILRQLQCYLMFCFNFKFLLFSLTKFNLSDNQQDNNSCMIINSSFNGLTELVASYNLPYFVG